MPSEASDAWVKEPLANRVIDHDLIDAYLSHSHATHERKEYEAWVSAVLMRAGVSPDVLMSDAGIDGDGDFVGSMDEPKPFVLQLRVRKVL